MNSLTDSQRAELVETALSVRENAYAPFSGFHVGAAILAEDGRIFGGVNVENSSYGLTICAERIAAGAMISAGAKQIVAVAVATPGAASPCGACRQFLYEFGHECRVLLVDSESGQATKDAALAELLPDGFRLKEGKGA